MVRTLVLRLLGLIPVLLLVSMLVFGLIVLIPGDPAVTLAGDTATPERVAEIRDQLGLNEPLITQYLDWLGGAVRFDFGTSLFSSQSVSDAISDRLPATLSLGAVTLVLSVLVGVSVGALAALRPGSLLDRIATVGASLGVAVPNFWLGLVLIVVFAVDRQWLPAGGYETVADGGWWNWLRHLILPAIALGAAASAEVARQTRSTLADVLQQDYIRTARAKGLPPVRVLGKHAMKNAAIPVVTVIGVQAGRLVGGTVVIEQAFSIPGVGSLAYQSVLEGDIPMVQGVVLMAALLVLLSNLLVDMSYGYFNPKLRSS
jgi:peptide/nickel transport system permease protein